MREIRLSPTVGPSPRRRAGETGVTVAVNVEAEEGGIDAVPSDVGRTTRAEGQRRAGVPGREGIGGDR